MKDIVLLESILLNDIGVVVTAIVEDMQYIPGSQTLIDPPEYAPAKCKITVPFEDIPPDVDLGSFDEAGLQEALNRYVNLDLYDWDIVTSNSSQENLPEEEELSPINCYF